MLWTNCLPPNTRAIIATQSQILIADVQLADKPSGVLPPAVVGRVSSSNDETSFLTAFAFPHRGHDGPKLLAICETDTSPDVCWYHRRYKKRAE